jgi:hypothetical protein
MLYRLNQLLSKLNLLITTSLMVLSVGFFFSFQAIAQQPENKKTVELSFVKTSSEQSSDSLYFNVLKVQNLTAENLELNLELELPDALLSMTTVPARVALKPNRRSNIAFRLAVSKNAVSSKEYILIARAKSDSGEILAQSTASILIKIHRAWELLSPVSELNVIAGNESMSTFSVPLRNNGNVPEKVNVQLVPPEGFVIRSGKRSVDQVSVDLLAGKDTLLIFSLSQKGKEKLKRTQDQLQITARNALGEFRKTIQINSYSSRYEYIQEKISLDNFIEVSHQVNLPNAQNREAVQARGKIPFAKEGREIQYSFMNYDLTNRSSFWERSYYNLNYSSKKVTVGIGQSYSSLGVDLYNTHGVFGDFKVDLNKTNQLLFYSSFGLKGDINSGAAGYQYKKNDFAIQASSGYSTNEMYKQNIGSGTFLSQIPLGKKQSLGINLRGVRRENIGDSAYFTNGLQGNFSYRLKLGKRFDLQARNLFNTPNFNRTNQKLFEIDATSSYRFEQNRELCFTFENNQRVYNAGQKLKQMGTENKVDDYNFVMYYQFTPSSKTSLKVGPWYKRLLFEEKDLATQTDAYNLYVEAKKDGRPGYSASLIAGYRQKIKIFPFANGLATVKKNYGNVHFTGGLNGTFWGMNVQYDYGPPQMLSNIRDMDYWLIRISPRLQGDFFNEKLLCQVNLDYTADWGRNYKYVNFRTSIEAILKNNWRLSFDGYVSTFGKLSLSTLDKDLRLDMRFSLRKDFNWGKKKSKTKNYNVDTYFFQDDNKNGIFDANEHGIDNGFLKMASERTGSEVRNISLSPVISDKSGKVSYDNIPEGDYQMDISRMINDDGYFNFSDSKKVLKLKKDTVCYIPFVKAYMISGNLKLTLANISSGKINSSKNIKVTATDSKGQQYTALTDMSGHYVLPVAGKEIYMVSINNPYGANVEVKTTKPRVEFIEKDYASVDFEFIEIARKVRMKSAIAIFENKEIEKFKKVNKPVSDQLNQDEKENTGQASSGKINDKEFNLEEIGHAKQPSEVNPMENLSKKDTIRNDKTQELESWIYSRISPDGKTKINYSVVGVFRNLENANKEIEKLKQKNIGAKWIYSDATKLYYVYVKETTVVVLK